jgi:hypothetical protein
VLLAPERRERMVEALQDCARRDPAPRVRRTVDAIVRAWAQVPPPDR